MNKAQGKKIKELAAEMAKDLKKIYRSAKEEALRELENFSETWDVK